MEKSTYLYTPYDIPDSQFRIVDLETHPELKKRFLVLCSVMMYEKKKTRRTKFYLGTTRMVDGPKSTKETEINAGKRFIRCHLMKALDEGVLEIGKAKRVKQIDTARTLANGIKFVTNTSSSIRAFSKTKEVTEEALKATTK